VIDIPGNTDAVAAVRQHCWNRALEAFGTSYLFQRRIRRPQRGIRWVAYLSLAVPLVIGLVVMAFGTDDASLPVLLWVGGILLVVQGLLALWSLVARWNDTIESVLLSITENNRLANRYKEIAERGPSDAAVRAAVLDAEYQARTEADLRQGITEQEKRMGMRAGLRQFQRACAACGKVPTTMDPSQCGVCGNFSEAWVK
jgi:mobilome CxxCx(11)CxxC protein